MKQILLLNDEKIEGAQLAETADPPVEALLRETEGLAGCNCDRWGHPCPGCVHRVTEPKAELPIFVTDQQLETKNGIPDCI